MRESLGYSGHTNNMINLATPQEKKQIINILRSDYPESNWNEFSPFEIERTGVIITTKQQGAIIASFGRKAFAGWDK